MKPKYTDPTAHTTVGGEIRCIVRNTDGSIDQDTGWFHNLITDAGLINMGTLNWAAICHIGSSSAAPAFTDTSLTSWLGQSSMTLDPVMSLNPVAPNYEFSAIKTARFGVGYATGTIREVGFGATASNSNLSVRALVTPAVSKAANQVLDVLYKFTRWPDIVDRTGTTMIAGESYDYIVRGSQLQALNGLGDLPQDPFSTISFTGITSAHLLFTGTIGTLEEQPSGFASNPWSDSVTYTGGGSGYGNYAFTWPLAAAPSGFRSVYIQGAQGSTKGYQIRLGKTSDDSNVDKDITKIITLNFQLTWSRH